MSILKEIKYFKVQLSKLTLLMRRQSKKITKDEAKLVRTDAEHNRDPADHPKSELESL